MSRPARPHVLFDLDGTLIDSAPAILASFRAAFTAAGVAPAVPIAPAVIGPPLTETLELLAGSGDAALIERLAGHFKASYDGTGYRATEPYAGVGEMLATLRRSGHRLYIATNKRIHPTRLILEHLGWGAHFEAVFALDLFSPRLPDKAAMIARLLAEHAIPPAGALYVGDREEDGLAADANRLPFVAATWGYGSIDAAALAPGWHSAATPAGLVVTLAQLPAQIE